MQIVTGIDGLAAFAGGVFVPTMGALHEGHGALVRRAASISGERSASGVRAPVVVSVFVNPTQFNDPSDLARYPRTLEADAELCRRAGADAVFVPGVEVMYPPGEAASWGVPELPSVATRPGLEDAHRPGHFAGVCQVVRRLFDLVRPRAALFGEKDWQQLAVIRAMTKQLGLPVEIVACETVREADGLAMSSRNRFLGSEERVQALAISRALSAGRAEATPEGAARVMRQVVESGGLGVEYAVVRDAETLQTPRAGSACRALIAARLGSVRLIDNAPWGR
jgi:pantoate--beta-alanine ligase